MLRTPRTLTLLTCAAALLTPAWASGQSARERIEARERAERAAKAFAEVTRRDVAQALAQVDDGLDFEAGREQLQGVFDRALAYGSLEDGEAFEEAAFALRLVRQADAAGQAVTPELWSFLRTNEPLARAVAFGLDERRDDIQAAYELLGRLHARHGLAVARQPQLTAAVCMVHDAPLVRHVNENTVTAADPVDVWAFYARNAGRMAFDLDATTPLLLTYVVNNAAPIEEMEWALNRYAGDRRVGNRYHDVAYDWNHFSLGQPKLVTVRGFTLPNIKQYGGICADQAYFAATVGKSIGVPTAEASAQGPDTGHVWVGYLEPRNRRAAWNFEEGRWDDYDKLIGRVRDPQSGSGMTEGDVAVLAELFGVDLAKVRRAAAMTDAAERIATLESTDADYPPPPPEGFDPDLVDGLGLGRPATLATRFALAEAALRQCAGYVPAWQVVRDTASHPSLTFEDKRKWGELLDRLCGRDYPAFMVSFMAPMIESIEDPRDQLAMWERLHQRVMRQPELAAGVCMRLGAQWERAGEKAKAYECYRVVVMNHTNDGMFVLDAVGACERMLTAEGRPDVLVGLLGDAFRRCQRPASNSPMAAGSIWASVGARYAAALDSAGQANKATSVRNQIKSLRDRSTTGGR